MRALFLCRVAGGVPDLPPMLHDTEDCLTYNGGRRGGYVCLSPRGLQRGAEVGWTQNVAVYLVRAPEAVIGRMIAADNKRWYWLPGMLRADEDDDTPTAETVAEDTTEDLPDAAGAREAAFKAWLVKAVNDSSITAGRKTSFITAINERDCSTEGKLRRVAFALCGTDWAGVKNGMIA